MTTLLFNQLRLISGGICFSIMASLTTFAQADLSVEPFEKGVLTEYQKSGWTRYLRENAVRAGCEYQDDPGLASEPDKLLAEAASGALTEPVDMTYRSYLRAPREVKDILGSQVAIQSLDCRNYYVFDGQVQGLPEIPIEEALDLMIEQYKEAPELETIERVKRQFRVAPIDYRYFFAFFLGSKDAYSLIGFDHEILMDMVSKVRGLEIYPDELAPGIPSLFFGGDLVLDTYGEAAEGECVRTPANPARELFIDKTLKKDELFLFFDNAGIKYEKGWNASLKLQEPVTDQEKENDHKSRFKTPTNPYFDTNRDIDLYSEECA